MSGQLSYAGTALDPATGPSVSEMRWLTSYADVDAVFRSRDIEQAGGGRRDSAPFVGGSLLSLSGTDHFERRRIESALFRPAALRRYETEILAPAWTIALSTATRIEGGVRRGELQYVLRMSLLRMSAAVSGLDGLESPEALERFMRYMAGLSFGVNAEWAVPDHRDVIQAGLAVKRLFAEEFFVPSLMRRRALAAEFQAGRLAREALPLDLITLMLLHPEHFRRWDDDLLLREVILFTGAPASIAAGVGHVIVALNEWFAAHPEDAGLTADTNFLRGAITDSLRLRPASPFLLRRALADLVLPSGLAITAGEYVVLDLVRAGRDTAVFGADAESFNPRREPLVRLKPFGMDFGSGAHTCIGMPMTMGAGTTPEDASLGSFIFLLDAFYRAGGRMDPAHPPEWNDTTTRNEYARFPVCFDLPQPPDA